MSGVKARIVAGGLLFGLAAACAAADLPKAVTPTPGPDLTGTYESEIPYKDFGPVPGKTLRSYAGTWYLTIDEASETYRIEGDKGGFSRVSGEFFNEGNSVIFNDEPAPVGAFNCYIDGKRTEIDGRASYEAHLEGATLGLTLEKDPCPLREVILERDWERL